MSFLSKRTLAFTLALATMSSLGNAKTRLLVGYSDDQGHSNILNYMDSQGDDEIIEVMDYKYTRPQRVSSVNNDNVASAQIIYTQEDAMSTGFSILEFDKDDVQSDMISLSGIDGVVSVEQDGEVYAFGTDQQLSEEGRAKARRLDAETTPYGIDMVRSAFINAQPDPVGATPITICIVSTGYDEGHPDLPTIAAHGVDGYSAYPTEFNQQWNVDSGIGIGAGTHSAGIIGAIGGNNIGVTGINPDPTKFKFFIAKALRNTGMGDLSAALPAIAQCVSNGAKVVDISLVSFEG